MSVRIARLPDRRGAPRRQSARDNWIVVLMRGRFADVQLLRAMKTNVPSLAHLQSASPRAKSRRLIGTQHMANAAVKKTAKKSAAKRKPEKKVAAKKSARRVVAKKAVRKGAVKKGAAKKSAGRKTAAKKKTVAQKSAAKRAPVKRKKAAPAPPTSEMPPQM